MEPRAPQTAHLFMDVSLSPGKASSSAMGSQAITVRRPLTRRLTEASAIGKKQSRLASFTCLRAPERP